MNEMLFSDVPALARVSDALRRVVQLGLKDTLLASEGFL
jgi:hypothetical protein